MLKEHATKILYVRRLVDVSLCLLSFVLAYFLQKKISIFNQEFYSLDALLILWIIIIPIWWIVFYQSKCYTSLRQINPFKQLIVFAKAFGLSMMIFLAVTVALKMPLPSRTFLILFSIINIGLLVLENFLLQFIVSLIRRKGFNTRNILIVGMEKEAQHLFDSIMEHKEWGIQVLGIISIKPISHEKSPFKNIQVLGNIKDFEAILKTVIVDMIFFAVPVNHLAEIRSSAYYCLERGISTQISVGLFEDLPYVNYGISEINNLPMLTLITTRHSEVDYLIKSIFDRIGAFLGLILLSPLFLALGFLIKKNSKGPIFFIQERIGQYGKPFKLYKFRSMVINAEELKKELEDKNEMSGPVFKITDDPRITSIGRFLRKTSMDELPQLINVLKGEMSLVGPRPPLASEVFQYDNWQRRRLSVKPGITCIWQVSGRNKIDFQEWMKMDLKYIDQWSLLEDVKLLLKTMPAVIFQKGAK